MIPQRDISRLANRLYVEACESIGKKQALRIPEAAIERDYCLAWLLCAMTQHPVLSEALAFKGGTALRRIHFGEYRFSEDLDFTDEPVRHVRNDTFYFEFQGPRPARNSVKVDVTRGETLVFALERKPMICSYSEYSDLPADRSTPRHASVNPADRNFMVKTEA